MEHFLVLKKSPKRKKKNSMAETRISLDEQNFRDLVAGKIIELGNTKILLEDIGYFLMMDIIEECQMKSELDNS